MTIITNTKSSTFVSKKRYTWFVFFCCCERCCIVSYTTRRLNSESVLYYMVEEGEVQNSSDMSLRMSVGFSALDGICDGLES